MSIVYLRALEPDDYLTSVKWRKDVELWSLLGSTMYYVSSAYEKRWVENAISDSANIKLAVCDTATNTYIGNVYLNKIDRIHRSAVIGIMIGERQYRGKGRGSAAIREMLNYAFNELGMHRVSALILEDNVASRKTFQKLGFREEGMYRDSLYKGGRFRNQVVVSLLAHEFVY